eukprot:6198843-Pleurochrysis_carterae.AAC.2
MQANGHLGFRSPTCRAFVLIFQLGVFHKNRLLWGESAISAPSGCVIGKLKEFCAARTGRQPSRSKLDENISRSTQSLANFQDSDMVIGVSYLFQTSLLYMERNGTDTDIVPFIHGWYIRG